MLAKRIAICALVLTAIAATAVPARAQVSSTTGAIIGTVTDNTKGIMPGVSVSVSGPALMGVRTVVTGGEGGYRIPALPPGEYKLVFELSGFATATRENIRINVGFTATIDVEMAPATLSETVNVSSASPVVDLASTKVTTDYGAEKLASLPGSRDYAAVTAMLPAVLMTQPSVGGSGAITYQRSTRYGLSGQDRGEVEGIVTTEAGTGGQEVGYTDSNSFQDMALNVIGNSAEMPNAGTYTVVVSKSGGNQYHGSFYQDFQNDGMEAHNIDARQIALGLSGAGTVSTVDLNRMVNFRDTGFDVGGYLIRDKMWWYGAYRLQHIGVHRVNLTDDVQVSELKVYTGKVSYNLTPNNKLSWYYVRGTKTQNDSLMTADTQLVQAASLRHQTWPNGPWKVDYNSVLGSNAMFEVRYGNFFEQGIYDPNSTGLTRYVDTGANWIKGTSITNRLDHQRPQLNGSLTYFKDGWKGSHNFKFGGESMHETNTQSNDVYNGMVLLLNNGAPSQVQLYLPKANSLDALWETGLYAQDTWKVNNRLTLNVGVRWDQYRSYLPAQVGPTGINFARIDLPVWNNVAPRLGLVYAITSDGRTLAKASYGQYYNDPYNDLASPANPNPALNFSLYAWTPTTVTYDSNGLPIYKSSDLGRLLSTTGARADGTPSTTVDPGLKNTFSRQATLYFEREVAPDFGVRSGFVWNAWRQGWGLVNTNMPYSAFNSPASVADPGPDGKAGTTDDGATLTAYNLDAAYLSLSPVQVIKNNPNQDSDFYTWEITANRRQVGRWSLQGSFSKTWSHAAPIAINSSNTLIVTPNQLVNTVDGRNDSSTWAAKISSTVDVGWGVRLSPMLRMQSGTPFARSFQAKLNYNSAVSIMAEPFGTERTANINIFDFRTEKTIRVKTTSTSVFFDVYNIFNTNAEQVVTTTSGSAFLRPSVVTAPRIARIGVKLTF